jgi:hypothetical protein
MKDVLQRHLITNYFNSDCLVIPIEILPKFGEDYWECYVYTRTEKKWFRLKGIIIEIDGEFTFEIKKEFTKEDFKNSLVYLFTKGIRI